MWDFSPDRIVIDGEEQVVPQARQGAIPWSTFVLLTQIQIETQRSVTTDEIPLTGMSQRFTVVLLFWTLFEVLIDSFYRAAFADLPGELGSELLRRFPSVGGRLDRLYRVTWQSSFFDDLRNAGFKNEALLLRRVQTARNAFIHGHPEAIDDELVNLTLQHLESVQRGWIELFNKRCIGRKAKIPIWKSAERRPAFLD